MIEEAIKYIGELFRGNSGGHDADHTMRVYHNALLIADREPGCNRELVALAALLHDADDHKLFHTQNNENARTFLREQGADQQQIEQICDIINTVSFSRNRGRRPETLEGRIVQDADRLDAIGAVGIARTFAYGGEHGRDLLSSIDHFYEKLLLLNDMMTTPTARAMAEARHQYMEDFLTQFFAEWNGER